MPENRSRCRVPISRCIQVCSIPCPEAPWVRPPRHRAADRARTSRLLVDAFYGDRLAPQLARLVMEMLGIMPDMFPLFFGIHR
eukprot:708198-Pyramimonas_sp.AAC.1